MQQKVSVVIISNEIEGDETLWVKACENAGIDFKVVNLTGDEWRKNIQNLQFDYLLAKPSCRTAKFKKLFDERIHILDTEYGYKIFPSPQEIYIYENKKELAAWLNKNNIPHPETKVFDNETGALEFSMRCGYPLVAKLGIGASGRGVKILQNQAEATKYIKSIFSGEGIGQSIGPDFKKGNVFKRMVNNIIKPSEIIKKFKKYREIYNDRQTGFVIFQKFIPHQFEWRVVRIGDSFFAHKKIVRGEKASGSLIKGYENPPFGLLNFVKQITDKHKMYSQAVDIFESENGYLINEMQCIFGQSDPYQMLVNGKKGRYLFKNNEWLFEEGDFNQNESYNLRLDWVLQEISHNKK